MFFTKFSRSFLFPVLVLITGAVSAQENEIGIWGGATNSFGDINNTTKSMQFIAPGAGAFYRYNFNTRLAWQFGVNGGLTYGYDSISNDPFQKLRNLSFRTYIYDFSTRIEFNFFSLDRTRPKYWFTPYVFMGLNLFYFNPQAEIDSQWVNLQPLGTEGQQFPELTGNDKYHRVQVGIPLGGGFKFALNENWTIGLEAQWHKLFTDYLDDVSKTYVDPAILASGTDGDLAVALADRSTEIDVEPLGTPGKERGDSKHRDAYLYTGVFISYTLVNLKCPAPGGKGFGRK